VRVPVRVAAWSAAVVSAAVVVSGQAPPASADRAAAPAAAWRAVFRVATTPSSIGGVTAIGPRNAWAAGSVGSGFGRLAVWHWDGSRWRRVSVPGLPASVTGGVIRASSGTNVWLFGQDEATNKPIVRRWDGKSWHIVPAPPDSASTPVVLGRANVWTHGSTSCVHNLRHCLTTMNHWNGRAWSQTSIPVFVDDMSGKPGSMWVIGEFGGDPSPPPTPGRPEAFRWTGHAWRKVTSMPSPLSFFTATISVASPRSVWVNAALARAGKRGPGYLLHWNGRRWRKIVAPASLTTFGPVTGDGSGGAWAGPRAHWTGRRWVRVKFGRSLGNLRSFEDMTRIPDSASLLFAGETAPSPSSRAFRGVIARIVR